MYSSDSPAAPAAADRRAGPPLLPIGPDRLTGADPRESPALFRPLGPTSGTIPLLPNLLDPHTFPGTAARGSGDGIFGGGAGLNIIGNPLTAADGMAPALRGLADLRQRPGGMQASPADVSIRNPRLRDFLAPPPSQAIAGAADPFSLSEADDPAAPSYAPMQGSPGGNSMAIPFSADLSGAADPSVGQAVPWPGSGGDPRSGTAYPGPQALGSPTGREPVTSLPLGTIVGSYRFMGGDPNDTRAWQLAATPRQ